ncbi:MAG: DsrH/TusB family sulfur metabolism protein [Moraxellaceae bacterium]|nr:DsrH/TusB family sulfur metabolism protein [Moraxellaceae bacterium]MDZ4387618.1 DsrH/TusB family sulfur metabolism protein [Moraxellaceae bacterium]
MSSHTLHVLSHQHALTDLKRFWQDGDCLLLTGDAVYLRSENLPQPCFALIDDVLARGLDQHWPTHITRISYSQWVAFSVDYARSVSWS